MSMAYFVAMKSKDRSTNVGAIIVAPDNTILSTGYNSFPRGLNDDIEARQQRPEKYHWVEHAERNAIYNAARKGICLENSILYTSGLPCTDCARGVIQAGIRKVIYDKDWNNPNFDEHKSKTLQMFHESGILVEIYKGPKIGRIVKKISGQETFL